MRSKNGTVGSEADNMFIKRLFSTIILLGLFGGSVFAPKPYSWIIFLLLCCLLTFTLVLEICSIVKNLGMETYRYLAAVVCTLFAAAVWTAVFRPDIIFLFIIIATVLPALSGPLFILFSKNSGEKIRKWFNTLVVSYFVMLPVFLIISVYFTGVHFGRRPAGV